VPGFSFFTDNHVRGELIKALRKRGEVVERAVDLFGEKNDDDILFAYASKEGRVFLTCDEAIHVTAHEWLRQGRTNFRMIYCTMERQQQMTVGELLAAIDAILQKPKAFAYQIEYIQPSR
jgi:hypothetical protein